MKNILVSLALLSMLITFFLGSYVLKQNRKAEANQSFLALMLAFLFWDLAEVKCITIKDEFLLSTYAFIIFLSYIASLTIFSHFSFMIGRQISPELFFRWPVSSFLFILSMIPVLVFSSYGTGLTVKRESWGLRLSFESALIPSIAKGYLLLMVIMAIFPLIRIIRAHGYRKETRRLELLGLAILLPVGLGPLAMAAGKRFLMSGNDSSVIYYIFGIFPLLHIFMSLVLLFTIICYNLLEIKIFFNRALVFSILALIISGIYVLVENLLQNLLQGIYESDSQIYGTISALFSAALFAPIHDMLSTFFALKTVNPPASREDSGANSGNSE